jgi:hypothetical protein
MLNLTEFAAILDAINIPHVYYYYPENSAPELPYFVYYYPASENIGADNVAYVEILEPVVELYTAEKSFETERTIEDAFNAAGIYWDKTEEYLTTEKMYMITYEITGVLNGEQN